MMINNRLSIILILLSVVFYLPLSCVKAPKYRDAIYITGTDLTTTNILTVDEGMSSSAFSVSSSTLLDKDLEIQGEVDTGLVQVYNERNDKSLLPLPEKSYSLSSIFTTIKAGSSVSDAIKMTVIADSIKEGVSYLLPITISKVSDNGPKILQSQNTIYFVVHRIQKVSAVGLGGSNYFTVDFAGKNERLNNMTEVTLECMIYVNSFQNRSPYISSLLGGEGGMLLRFGDVTIEPNQLQAAGSTPVQTDGSLLFSTQKWYHVAVVVDAQTVKLYVNGSLDAGKPILRQKNIDITKDFCIGCSYDGRYFDGKITEVRIWSIARTGAQLQSNICSVDPTTPGLEADWRMNEGSGSVAYDATKYKRNAVAARTVKWESGIKCQL